MTNYERLITTAEWCEQRATEVAPRFRATLLRRAAACRKAAR